MQGNRSLEDLTALQELRIGTSAGIQNFKLHLDGLPPSLRRLSVTHGMDPPYRLRKLLAVAPPLLPASHPAADGPATHFAMCQAATAQHPAVAIPDLLSLVLRCPMMLLPAATAVPLPASCTVTLDVVNLTVVRSLGHSPWVSTDRTRVTSLLPPYHRFPDRHVLCCCMLLWPCVMLLCTHG